MSDDHDKDSDFEEIGYDDLESEVEKSLEGAGSDDESGAGKQRFVVEFPKSFPNEGEEPCRKKSRSDQSSNASSSFLPVNRLSALGIESESGSWSRVDPSMCASSSSFTCGENSSSVISGFDVLSINGGSMRRCRRCSFLNEEKCGICVGCGTALVANPCPGIDEQIARNLAAKEEQLAFQILQQEERARESLAEQPLLEQAQLLVKDVINCVSTYRGHGICSVPEANLVILALRLIEFVRTQGCGVSVVYHFASKLQWRFHQVRKEGLGSHARVSTNVEAALKWNGNDIPRRSNGTKQLRSIPEEELTFASEDRDFFSPKQAPNDVDHLGWICAVAIGGVAVVPSSKIVNVTDNVGAVVEILSQPAQSLPLVCFDASSRKDTDIKSLFTGLSRIFNDFFPTNWLPVEEPPISNEDICAFLPVAQKPKTGGSEAEEIDLAFNAALESESEASDVEGKLDDEIVEEMFGSGAAENRKAGASAGPEKADPSLAQTLSPSNSEKNKNSEAGVAIFMKDVVCVEPDLVGKVVAIEVGRWKGQVGTITDVFGANVRVRLQNQRHTIDYSRECVCVWTEEQTKELDA